MSVPKSVRQSSKFFIEKIKKDKKISPHMKHQTIEGIKNAVKNYGKPSK